MPKSTEIIPDLLSETTNRRSMLKKLAMATAAVGTASTLGSTAAVAATAPADSTPFDVVQFALGLEYLEAEFYTIATTGKTLEEYGVDTSGSGRSGPTTTKYGMVDFSGSTTQTGPVAMDIAADERAHVKLLRAALTSYGVTPVAKPTINLDAIASLGASLENMTTFLRLARIFEDIGVTAYAGAATSLVSAPPVLMYAARILAVEGEHVANIRLQIAMQGISTFTLDAVDIIPPPSGTNYFSTNIANGLVGTRTPYEVLFLAFGDTPNAGAGGFFPMGYNGAYHHSSAASAPASNLA